MALLLSKNRMGYLIFIFVILLASTIFFDIPVMRQFVGFIFLLFVPGYCIIHVLNLDLLGVLEKIVLSVGLSTSYVMIFGYLLNQIALFLGYQTPFSTFPLLIFLSLSLIVIFNLRKNKEFHISYKIDMSSYDKVFIICSIFLVMFSILGTYIINKWGNNEIILLQLILIPIVSSALLFCNYKGLSNGALSPLLLYAISLSVVLLMGLRLNYVIGDDSCNEYYFFKTTLQNLHWGIIKNVTLDSCLSISILPAIYQSITKCNTQLLFKILYPLILSFCPLVAYSIARQFFDNNYSFIAGLFFISQYGFKITSLWCRINIAIFFFSLFIFALVNTKIPPVQKKILIIIFLTSVIVSHYSTTYILFFILLFTVSLSLFFNLFNNMKRDIGFSIIFLYFCLFMYWYSIINFAPFHSGVLFISKTFQSATNVYTMDSKGGTVQKAVGSGLSNNVPMQLEFVYSWLVILLIGIGALYVLYYLFKSIIHKENNYHIFALNIKTSIEYLLLVLSFFFTLVFSVLSSHICVIYGLERIFFQSSVVTSSFFIIGGLAIGKKVNINPLIVLLFILVPFFLNTMGVSYQLLGAPRDIILNSEGSQYEFWHIKDVDYYGAQWLGNKIEEDSSIAYDTNWRALYQQFSAYHPFLPYGPENLRLGKYTFHSYNYKSPNIVTGFPSYNNITSFNNITEQLDRNQKIYTNNKNMMIFAKK